MSIHSRLSTFEKSLKYRELALLWLKTAQGRSAYSEYWKIGEFQPWASDNKEAGLLYHLAFEVNGAVMTAAQGWRALMSWASLLAISMIDTTPRTKPFELATVRDFPERWREKLCALLADVVTLERAVNLICDRYFDGHDVLFKDSRGALTASYEDAQLLVAGYNCFAQENGKEAIDIDALERPGRRVGQYLNEWVMLSQSKVLVACGEIFEARDKVLALLKSDDPGTDV
jgi:hypothetical protein